MKKLAYRVQDLNELSNAIKVELEFANKWTSKLGKELGWAGLGISGMDMVVNGINSFEYWRLSMMELDIRGEYIDNWIDDHN